MNTPPDSFGELLNTVRSGNMAGLDQLLVRYQPWLQLLARMQIHAGLKGKFSESDVVQQTLLEACRDIPEFRGQSEAELLAWLRRILAHVISHEVRRYRGTQQRDVHREVSLEAALEQSSLRLRGILAANDTSPSQRAVQKEEELRLAEVLARLSPEHQDVILLRNIQGLSHEEVAVRMGRTVGAVRMLWVRALEQLRAAMASH